MKLRLKWWQYWFQIFTLDYFIKIDNEWKRIHKHIRKWPFIPMKIVIENPSNDEAELSLHPNGVMIYPKSKKKLYDNN